MSRSLVIGLLVATIAILAVAGGFILLDDDGPDDRAGESSGDAEVGQSIYEQQCSGCHTIDGSDGVGPSFDGLFGSEVTMEDGSTVTVDGDHLVESITDPQAQIREGYPSVMPSFSNLSEDELQGLVAFIQSLE